MIQGQINSMIAQVGNMAHVWKTLRNTESTLANEKKNLSNETKVKETKKKVEDYFIHRLEDEYTAYGTVGRVSTNMAKRLILDTDEYEARGYWQGTKPEWDNFKAGLATRLTAKQVASMNELREQMRKPSTVKTPGGNNNGQQK